MSKLKINIDYKRKDPVTEEEKKAFLPDAELTLSYIQYGARKKYPDGIKGTELKVFSRIQNKVEDAIDEKNSSVEFEKAEVDFLKSIFYKDDIAYPTDIAKYIVRLLDEMDKLFLEAKKK